ncbi:MAG: protein-L-isoaspartate(D-aspartate) O-methyltransferase [Candidatus Helarchaeota archaeon]|nr:protein-L-isoaspartate(D-aspartate) O-methyltransferase [Candidatus Helarchaeota archaeon]
MDLAAQKNELIRRYKKRGLMRVLHSEAVERAFRQLRRELFMPRGLESRAYTNRAYFIAEGSTISAPYMHIILAEALNLQKGQKVLEVGTGSGYQAALCALIVAPLEPVGAGHVFTIETLPQIVQFAKENIEKADLQKRVTVICSDGTLGLPEEAPFDRILVTAYAKEVPPALIEQLKVGGQLVMPVGRFRRFQSLIRLTKVTKKKIKKKTLRRYSVYFVRLIGAEGWSEK